MKKNTHYFNGQKSKRKIVYGKEKAQEYNAISQEIEKTFCNWLDGKLLQFKRLSYIMYCIGGTIHKGLSKSERRNKNV